MIFYSIPCEAQTLGNITLSTEEYGTLRQGYSAPDIERRILENQALKARQFWALRKEWRKHMTEEGRYFNYIEHQRKILYDAELRYALKLKKKEMVEKGILPPPLPQAFRYEGKTYATYADFKGTVDWQIMKRNASIRNELRKLEEEKEELERYILARESYEDFHRNELAVQNIVRTINNKYD